MKPSSILICILLFASCNSSKDISKTNTGEVSSENIILTDPASASECYKNRESTDKITDMAGEIRQINDAYYISCEGDTKRYLPCELPEATRAVGVKVQFSGMLKQVKPHERWIARPFVLEKIEIKN